MMRLSPSELAVQLEALDLKYTTQVPFPEINAAVVVMRSWFSSHQAWDGGFFGMRQNGKEDGMFRAAAQRLPKLSPNCAFGCCLHASSAVA